MKRITSGGQTGVDRAALDVAIELGIPCGGWCPRNRRAEDGRISDRYPLREAPSASYSARTVLNVADADGTLILTVGRLTGGTRLTKQTADNLAKPCLVVDPINGAPPPVDVVLTWLRTHSIRVLNVAGPRASQQPALSRSVRRFLRVLFSSFRSDPDA